MSRINGMTQAAGALRYWERRQEVVANNLANVDSSGFKAERVFARLLGGEGPVADTVTDLRAGSLKATGSPLDLALGGDGFFVVETPNGERLTRGGSFSLDEGGRMVDAHGNALLGENGPLTVSGGTVTIDAAGRVVVDGREVSRIRVEAVPADARLVHEGGTLFVVEGERTPVAPEARLIRQGHLEESNVSSVGALVDMISIQRSYAAVQRTMTTLDEVRRTIANEIAKPA